MSEREYFYEAVEVGGPEPYGDGEEITQLHRILMAPDPIEAARQELVAGGITDPEHQRPVLRELYLELQDPGRLQHLREMAANGEI